MTDDATVDVAVIGGGAAGLMAAYFSAAGGARTVLLESAKSCGLKILVSGGGRCNVLPSEMDDSDFFTQGSRNVLKRLFRTWRLAPIHEWFEEELGLELVLEEDTGKIFPASQSAKEVRDRLVAAVENAGATIEVSTRVTGITATEGCFSLACLEGEPLLARRIVMSTGGQSLPKTGSDGAGYGFLEGLGHTLVDRYPALVPLKSPDDALKSLTGIALPVRWRAIVGKKVREERTRELLFTHRGFSGPSMLDASHWVVRDGAKLEVSWGDMTPEDWERIWRADVRKRIGSLLAAHLPRRLAEVLMTRARIASELRYSELTRIQCERLLSELCQCRLEVNGNEGYGKAEVTGGGIPLGEVNPSTLESRVAPGLFICGEILDVIGRIGGYNFLWAWVTGRLAGERAALEPVDGDR